MITMDGEKTTTAMNSKQKINKIRMVKSTEADRYYVEVNEHSYLQDRGIASSSILTPLVGNVISGNLFSGQR